MFAYKPDFEKVLDRYEAWWDAQIPLVSITFARPAEEQIPWPSVKDHPTLRDRWLDTEYVVDNVRARMANTRFYADALPTVFPNLGPEIFSAFYGCPLEFSEGTSWSVPILDSWDQAAVDGLKLDTNSFYFRKLVEMTDGLIDVGKGKFIVGYTDIHPGGDGIAAFRDPQEFCFDVLEHPAEVKALVDRVTDDFFQVYDYFYEKLSAAGMPSTSWLPATCKGKYHIPSNDFSCMISDEMFADLFLPGIARECAHMDRCIYHLDGPQALRFLDPLLLAGLAAALVPPTTTTGATGSRSTSTFRSGASRSVWECRSRTWTNSSRRSNRRAAGSPSAGFRMRRLLKRW